MEEVWETVEKVRIHIAGDVVEVEAPVTAEQIRGVAKTYRIRKFRVSRDADGNELLKPSDFPVDSGDIYIIEYNVAA